MKKVTVIEQSEHSECGLACVTMLFSLYDRKIRLSHLRNKYGVPNGGYNLLQLSKVLSESGISNIGVKINDIRAIPSVCFPFIAHFGNAHFVIVESIKKEHVNIVDPAIGREKMMLNDFCDKFTGAALIIKFKESKYQRITPEGTEKKFDIKSGISIHILSIIILLSVCIQVISFFLPNLLKTIIDDQGTGLNFFVTQVIFSVCTYYLLSAMRIIVITKFQIILDKYLLEKVMSYLLKLPLSFFTNRGKGELLFRINSNSYIRQLISESFSGLLVDVLFSCVYLCYLFSINIRLTMVVIGMTVIVMLITVIFTIKYKKIQENQVISSSATQGKVAEIMNNMPLIKSYGIESKMYIDWKEMFERQMLFEWRKAKYLAYLGNIRNIFPMLLPIIVYAYGSILVKQQIMTMGQTVSFNAITGLFVTPIVSLGTIYNNV